MSTLPIDVATQETLEFVAAHLPPAARRLLEVGAGSGHLAKALAGRGYVVTAIDASAEAVHKAAKIGARVQLATWPDFDGDGFDAVLFTRSLHHVHALDRAVAKASECLRPGGLLIVDDFDCMLVTMEHHHHHELHSAAAMRGAIAARFQLVHESKVPYLYRYLVQPVPHAEAFAQLAAEVLALEKELGAKRDDRLIGRRFVGRKL